jgi:hypothetical protein
MTSSISTASADASPRTLTIGGQALPLDATDIATGRDISLSPVSFDFVYGDIKMRGRCVPDEDGATVRVTGNVGPLPFTAESPDARIAVQAIVDDANAVTGTEVFRVVNGHVMLATECRVALPVSAVGLVSAVAAQLLPIRPYLALMAEVVRPPLQAAGPGESVLRPGWRRRRAARPG